MHFIHRSIQVTPHDIARAATDGMRDPCILALSRSVGTPWKMSHIDGVAIETQAPHRTVILPYHVMEKLREFRARGSVAPFEFVAQIQATEPDDRE